MASMSFVNPSYLIFLLLIPLFILFHIISLKTTKTTALKFANFDAIARIRGIDFFSKNLLILFLSIVVVFLFVMALAGLTVSIEVNASSYSFVIAIDTSQSMEANDIIPNRLEAAKSAARNFIDILPFGTQVGVISFSGNALIESDITETRINAKSAISDIEISDISGTDIYEAVITGSNMLKGEETGAVILLSDGQSNVADPEQIISYAKRNNVVIYAIAIGTEEGGAASYGVSKVDEEFLKSLAYNTDGQFFMATSEEELINSFASAITTTKRNARISLRDYLLIAGIILFALEYVLINSRYKQIV